jgi:hypothetical protein
MPVMPDGSLVKHIRTTRWWSFDIEALLFFSLTLRLFDEIFEGQAFIGFLPLLSSFLFLKFLLFRYRLDGACHHSLGGSTRTSICCSKHLHSQWRSKDWELRLRLRQASFDQTFVHQSCRDDDASLIFFRVFISCPYKGHLMRRSRNRGKVRQAFIVFHQPPFVC